MKETVTIRIIHGLGVIALVVVVFFPFYWLLASSLKTSGELLTTFTLVPRQPTFEHYRRILFETLYPQYAMNSLIVVGATTMITMMLAVITAYSLSSFNYPFKRTVERGILYTRMFPGVLLMIPVYVFMAAIGLLNTFWGLIAIYVTIFSPVAILLLRSFFDQIPKELSESAYVDGADRAQTLYRVILPLLKPGLVTVAAWAFILSWSEYQFALILIHDQTKRTLVVGLAAWMGEYHIDWGALTAGSVLLILPAVIFFAIFGRGFIKGLTAGALKG